MGARKAVLVAADFLESKLLQGLAEQLHPAVESRSHLGFGQLRPPVDQDDLKEEVKASDLVIVAISEYVHDEVLTAMLAKELGKPLVIMALGYSSWARPEFEPVRGYAKLLFVVDTEEAVQARILFPNAKVEVTGSPQWESFSFPTYARDEVRSRLGFTAQEKFVLISGEKEMGVNFPLAVCVIEAIRELPNPERYRVIFGVHSGHADYPGRSSGTSLFDLYRELETHEPRVHVRLSYKTEPFGIGTPDMVPGADIVIGTNSTVQIQAAFLRIPAIAILLRRSFRGRVLPEVHRGWWPPCDRQAVEPIYGLSSVRTRLLIESFSNFGGSTLMRAAQERAFPPFTRVGEAFDKMKAEILQP